VFERLRFLLGGGLRLPGDQTTRIPRRIRKKAKVHVDAMQAVLDELGGLQGLADVPESKQLPRGFHGLVDKLTQHYDAYVDMVREDLGLTDTPRPGEPGGCNACYSVPFGVSGAEALHIYRKVRTRKDFPKLANRIGTLGEQQFADIQANAQGKDAAQIRGGSKAVQQGRIDFAKRGEPCPFLDVDAQRCKIWEARPFTCRMHHATSDPAWSDARHENFSKVKAKNIRLPVKAQVALAQIDKRMGLQIAPFLYASLLQILQLADGEVLTEVGEPALKMGQDGSMQQRANRDRGKSKRDTKKKQKQKQKTKKKNRK
jgi:Fe-S-cluster containining protein